MNNIIISQSKGKKYIRQIDDNKELSKIAIYSKLRMPFGIDMVYGKRYAKVKLFENEQQVKDRDIRLSELVENISSCFYKDLVQTVIDKNFKLYDSDGKELSSFAIDKGTTLNAWLYLNDIYEKNNSYRWYIQKAIIVNN